MCEGNGKDGCPMESENKKRVYKLQVLMLWIRNGSDAGLIDAFSPPVLICPVLIAYGGVKRNGIEWKITGKRA